MKTPRLSLRISRSTSSRETLEISSPLKSPRKPSPRKGKKVFEPVPDAPVYFAFQIKDAVRLDNADPAKNTYFIKKLESLKCERVVDDEIDLEKDSHIIIRGPYSKLFEIFSLILYLNVFDVNAIKTQFLMKNQGGDTLIILPLVRDDLKTYESENSTLAKMFSPRREKQFSEAEIKLRKQLEDDEYQRKVYELELKHRAFLEEHGLVPSGVKSPKSKMKEALHELVQGLQQRNEKLEELQNETDLLEQNTADFAQKARKLRIQEEAKSLEFMSQ